jgi:hypothetical protein
MPAIIAQEIDVVQPIEPIGIVDEERVFRPAAEAHEIMEHRLDAGDV